MAFLFSTNKKGTVVFHKDVMGLCPEFSVLDDKDKLCLVLIADYESPYNQLPETDRVSKASVQVYGKANTKKFSSQVWKNALEAYKSLQYNPKVELKRVYENKITALSSDLEKASVHTAVKSILESQKAMRKGIEELEEEISGVNEHKIELRGKGVLSLLEEITSNKEEYDRVTAKR